MRLFAQVLKAIVAISVIAVPSLGTAEAQWPSRPITLVVAFAPGALSDYNARVIAQDLAKTLGQPVIVENKPGGGGIVASVSVAKAPADGYTLLVTAIGPAVLRPLIDPKLSYDSAGDFTPIILIGESPNILAVSAKSSFTSIQDVVAYGKRNPGKLAMGHPGPGTMGHLIALLFAMEAGIDMNYIAYAGGPPILADLAGGHIDIGSMSHGPGVEAAKILAVPTQERLDFLPDVPTMKECGYPEVVGSTWNAIVAPAGVPAEIVARLNTAIDAFLAKEDTRKQFYKVGFRVMGGAPDRLRERILDDRARWSKIVKSANITAD
jgi:tripartite-type tricarboxylate transporter receptor subunit TctC